MSLIWLSRQVEVGQVRQPRQRADVADLVVARSRSSRLVSPAERAEVADLVAYRYRPVRLVSPAERAEVADLVAAQVELGQIGQARRVG